MAAIGRRHDVVGAQNIADADRDRFLTYREMHRTLDFVRRINPRNFLFGAANEAQTAVNALKIGDSQRVIAGRRPGMAGYRWCRVRAFPDQDFTPSPLRDV
ncbi:MAG TPA: hypothetical protein VMF32_01750 [Xanthobacteraceae bacterium]|nr:hypothetical protein [Xanthobacteraceae bacterium]